MFFRVGGDSQQATRYTWEGGFGVWLPGLIGGWFWKLNTWSQNLYKLIEVNAYCGADKPTLSSETSLSLVVTAASGEGIQLEGLLPYLVYLPLASTVGSEVFTLKVKQSAQPMKLIFELIGEKIFQVTLYSKFIFGSFFC